MHLFYYITLFLFIYCNEDLYCGDLNCYDVLEIKKDSTLRGI